MPLVYWIFVSLTLALTTFIGYGTYRTSQLLRTWQPEQNLLLMPGETVVRFVLIGVCIGLGLLSGLSAETLGWDFADLDRQLLWGLGWGIVLAGFFIITTRWVIEVSGERFYSFMVLDYILPDDTRELVLVALAMGPVVLLEELLFRSLLIGGLTPLAPPVLLVVAAGLIFGLMHSPQGIWGMSGATGVGILFGLLFLQAGSLVLPLVAHYVTNMLQIGFAMRTRAEKAPGS
ncbi:MAG: CPBP family intramembrane metalloprotease [Caldilineaceae bacterium]|nr:CPBP family intramembrane metalloprotease [Caldilineaceae bacterium]